MIIKVCGLREPENIRAISALDIDLMGFIYWDGSVRCVKHAPVLPNKRTGRVGVFVDETPQVIMTHVRNDALNYIQLHGNERAADIEKLRCRLISELLDAKMIKALSIREADDVKRWRDYEGVADLLLFDNKCAARGGSGEHFDWSMLNRYDGDIPFLLSGGIGLDDADRILTIHHPQFAGVDINSRFEIRPAVKDTEKLQCFIQKIRTYEQNQ